MLKRLLLLVLCVPLGFVLYDEGQRLVMHFTGAPSNDLPAADKAAAKAMAKDLKQELGKLVCVSAEVTEASHKEPVVADLQEYRRTLAATQFVLSKPAPKEWRKRFSSDHPFRLWLESNEELSGLENKLKAASLKDSAKRTKFKSWLADYSKVEGYLPTFYAERQAFVARWERALELESLVAKDARPIGEFLAELGDLYHRAKAAPDLQELVRSVAQKCCDYFLEQTVRLDDERDVLVFNGSDYDSVARDKVQIHWKRGKSKNGKETTRLSAQDDEYDAKERKDDIESFTVGDTTYPWGEIPRTARKYSWCKMTLEPTPLGVAMHKYKELRAGGLRWTTDRLGKLAAAWNSLKDYHRKIGEYLERVRALQEAVAKQPVLVEAAPHVVPKSRARHRSLSHQPGSALYQPGQRRDQPAASKDGRSGQADCRLSRMRSRTS